MIPIRRSSQTADQAQRKDTASEVITSVPENIRYANTDQKEKHLGQWTMGNSPIISSNFPISPR